MKLAAKWFEVEIVTMELAGKFEEELLIEVAAK